MDLSASGVIDATERRKSATLGRSAALDAVRGCAILLILVHHYLAPLVENLHPLMSRPLALTWSGVDLFFVLSGFLIGGILIDQKNATNFYGVFYGRRALRILPLYVVSIAGFIAIAGMPRIIEFLAYATFTQNVLWSIEGRWGPAWVGITWSLAVEEQFYLFLPLFIRLCPPRCLRLC